MNREIKFRFFDGAKMCEVGDLTFFADRAGYHINGEFPSTGKDPYPLMQFTGLKDKNGKEIYEGDIVKQDANNIGFIEYDKGSFSVVDRPLSDYEIGAGYIGDMSDTWEVIGNIYENPELLSPNPTKKQ